MKLFIVAVVVLLLSEMTFALWVRADIRVDLKKKKRIVSDPDLEERGVEVNLPKYSSKKLADLKEDLTKKIGDLLNKEKNKFDIKV